MKQGQAKMYKLSQVRDSTAVTALAVPPNDVKWTVKGPNGFVWEQIGSGDGLAPVARLFLGPVAVHINPDWLAITVQYLDAGTFSVTGACISLNAGADKIETIDADAVKQKLVLS